MAKFLYYHTEEDIDYMAILKPMLQGNTTILKQRAPVAVTEMLMDAKQKEVKQIILSQPAAIKLIVPQGAGTQDDFAGSIIKRGDVEFLILNPLKHLVSVNYGKFLFDRYLSKFTAPQKWFHQTKFSWELANETTIPDLYQLVVDSLYVAVDIETSTDNRRITCVSYTCVGIANGVFDTHSFVIPLTSLFWLECIRKLNATKTPKILQNGKYDHAYFFRFGVPCTGWYFDTVNLFHSYYSELPKRLDFLSSFSLRYCEFWKNSGAGSLEDYYRYNARDGYYTANSFLSIIRDIPDWAISNYLQEFPTVFPCHQAEMTGLQVDLPTVAKLKVEQETVLEGRRTKLGIMVSSPIAKKGKLKGKYLFNPSSHVQVQRLMKVLGCDISKGTGEIQIKKAIFQHPLNGILLDAVLEFRKARKLVSTYLVEEKFWKGRCYYALNPHGTDTARLASRESQFAGWGEDTELAGLQIHNIPRDRTDIEIKSVFVSDEGFEFGEGDYEQAEAWDVGYLSGDKNLLDTLHSGKDFHALNVERFFGVPYAKVFDDTNKKTLDVPLRYLSKRVNHGSNYNMGWQVLVDTMGLENIYKAKTLLGLNKYWGPKQIATFLLERYETAYPGVKGAYYDHIKYCVKTTKMLVSALGWTRYCFGNPEKSKHALNSYVAHPSQNLNAGCLNRAWMRIFTEVALKEPKDFKLCAQIHDSILFQYRRGRLDLVRKVHECMLFSIKVKDCKGIERDLRVPVAMKAGATRWSDIKPLESLERMVKVA